MYEKYCVFSKVITLILPKKHIKTYSYITILSRQFNKTTIFLSNGTLANSRTP